MQSSSSASKWSLETAALFQGKQIVVTLIGPFGELVGYSVSYLNHQTPLTKRYLASSHSQIQRVNEQVYNGVILEMEEVTEYVTYYKYGMD